jgi:hypothetical protein
VHPFSVLIKSVSPVHKHRVNFFGRGEGSLAHHVEGLREVLHHFFRRLLGTMQIDSQMIEANRSKSNSI